MILQIVLLIIGLSLAAVGFGLTPGKQRAPLSLPLRATLVVLGLAFLGGGATLAARPAPAPQLELQGSRTSVPPAPTRAPQMFVEVPNLRDLTLEDATTQLRDAGLLLGDAAGSCSDIGVSPPAESADSGRIICQSPEAGALAPAGMQVIYVLAP